MTADQELPSIAKVIEEVVEDVYGDRIGRRLGRRASILNGHHHTVIHHVDGWDDTTFEEILSNARSQSLMSEQDEDEITCIHTITAVENPQDGSITYAAMDLAVTVQDRHIERLAARADILRRITGKPVTTTITGAFVADDSLRQLAQERDVDLLYASLDDAKMERIYSKDILREIYSERVKIDPARKEIYE